MREMTIKLYRYDELIRKKYPYKDWALDVKKYENKMLTVFCWDYLLNDAYKDFINNAKKYGSKRYTLDDFFELLALKGKEFLQGEYDGIEEEDFIKDTCNANNWKFTEDGEKW